MDPAGAPAAARAGELWEPAATADSAPFGTPGAAAEKAGSG